MNRTAEFSARMRRVAVTGIGVICALGRTAEEFWEKLSLGGSGVRDIQSLDTSKLRFYTGAEVLDHNPAEHFDGTQQFLLDRFSQFAVIAAREAIGKAGVTITPGLASRIGVVTGSSVGGQSSQDAEFRGLYLHATNRVHPLTIPRVMMNAGASHICMDLGITGPAMPSAQRIPLRTMPSGKRFGWCDRTKSTWRLSGEARHRSAWGC
jgi:nodulation protein E